MKRFLLLLLITGIFGCLVWFFSSPKQSELTPEVEVLSSELSLVDGQLRRKGDATPFTGVMIERYPDGKPKSRSAISNGVMHGVSEGWFTNGVKQVTEHFLSGTSHGQRTKWHLNGMKQSEAQIANGKLTGQFRRWDEQGKLSEEIEMVNGEPHGLSRAYHPDGTLKAEVRLDKGKVIDQKFFPASPTNAP